MNQRAIINILIIIVLGIIAWQLVMRTFFSKTSNGSVIVNTGNGSNGNGNGGM